MSSDRIRLREIDQAIQEARRHILLLCDQKREEKRASELRLKRMVLHREILASNPVLLTAIQPEVLRARLSP
jgi:regulator of extracellular matrix RemA (YlzA/DUF370 family)